MKKSRDDSIEKKKQKAVSPAKWLAKNSRLLETGSKSRRLRKSKELFVNTKQRTISELDIKAREEIEIEVEVCSEEELNSKSSISSSVISEESEEETERVEEKIDLKQALKDLDNFVDQTMTHKNKLRERLQGKFKENKPIARSRSKVKTGLKKVLTRKNEVEKKKDELKVALEKKKEIERNARKNLKNPLKIMQERVNQIFRKDFGGKKRSKSFREKSKDIEDKENAALAAQEVVITSKRTGNEKVKKKNLGRKRKERIRI